MRLLACLTITAGICGTAYAADVPKFKDYPARIYTGARAPVRFDTPQANQYRTRLRDAAKQPVNFGGRYVFAHWGGSPQCETGALIDVATGQVYFLPFTACNWESFGRPFEFRQNSLLIVVVGQRGEDGPSGAHFFEFTGKNFKLISEADASPEAVEPSAGPVDSSSSLKDVKEAIQPQLWGALNRAGFQTVSTGNSQFKPANISQIADIFLATSFRQPLEINGIKYDLFYNWQADLFALIHYENGIVHNVGFLSGTAAAQIYKLKDEENIFRSMLVARPALAMHLAKDLHLSKDPDGLFTKFIDDEEESLRVQTDLLSMLELLNKGLKDPCHAQAKAYLQGADIKFEGMPALNQGSFYVGIGFPTPDARVLAFGDEASNQRIGFVVYDLNDTKSCKPKSVLTSRFQM